MVEKKEEKKEPGPEIKVEVPKEEKKEEKEAKKEAKPEVPKAEKEPRSKVTVDLSKKAEEIIRGVESLSVLELADLVKALEKKFGVVATAPVAMAAPGAAPGAPRKEEKTTFDVILKEVGPQKIQVIKVVRSLTDLGLKEAKALVDGVPKSVKVEIPKEEAEEVKKKLEEVGAKVELK